MNLNNSNNARKVAAMSAVIRALNATYAEYPGDSVCRAIDFTAFNSAAVGEYIVRWYPHGREAAPRDYYATVAPEAARVVSIRGI